MSYQLNPSKQLLAWSVRELSTVQAYLLAFAIAIAFLMYMFPMSMFKGDSTIFDFGDNAQHVSGWLFYAKDSWHFPLLHTSRLDHPEGIKIAFTDSIPLAALFFKALMTIFPSWFPEHFHYFGWWIGFVFCTQALAATLLLRVLGVNHLWGTVVIVLFVLTWPVIQVRYSHAALMLHSILISGLALYFLGIKQVWREHLVSALFIALHIVSLLVHPYFLPFTFGLYFAYLFDTSIKQKNWTKPLKRLTLLFVLLAGVAWMMGYFGRKTEIVGYGHYHLNLASPFCGDSKLIHCGFGDAIVRFEGFNYFGAGLIFLLPIALILYWRELLLFPKRYPALFIVLCGLFLYAVTNSVRIGSYQLFSYALPEWTQWLTGTFRAAGRFFWLIGYLILFATLVVLLKKKSWPLFAIVSLALLLQLYDTKPYRDQIRKLAVQPSSLRLEEWGQLMQQVDKVVVYPVFHCGRSDFQYYTWLMQLAGYHGKLLNSGYTSRDKKDCAKSEQEAQKPLKPRHLYVMHSQTYYQTPFKNNFVFPAPIQEAINNNECVKRIDSLVCLPGSTQAYWESLKHLGTNRAQFAENSFHLSSLELNSPIGKPSKSGYDANLIPTDPEIPGWLSHGPYWQLPVGNYQYEITYLSKSAPESIVGNWDVVFQHGEAGGEKVMANGVMNGSHGAELVIRGEISVTEVNENKPFEMRTFFLAKGDLEIVGVSLTKVD